MWGLNETILSLIQRPQPAPEPSQLSQEDTKGGNVQTPTPEKWILGARLRPRPDVDLQVGTALELGPISPLTFPHPGFCVSLCPDHYQVTLQI